MELKNKLKYAGIGTIVLASSLMNGCGTLGSITNGLERKISNESSGYITTPINLDNKGDTQNEEKSQEKEKAQEKEAPALEIPDNENKLYPNFPSFLYRKYDSDKSIDAETYLFGPLNSRAETERRNILERINMRDNKENKLENGVKERAIKLDHKNVFALSGGIHQFEDKFKTDKTAELLTEVLYAEGRDVREDGAKTPSINYLENIAASVINRSNNRNKSPTEIVTAEKQYSYLNPDDPGKNIKSKAKEHAKKNKPDWDAYLVCKKVAEEIIKIGTDKSYDHYFVREIGVNDQKIPSYYSGVEASETFFHTIKFRSGKEKKFITRFYSLDTPNKKTILALNN